LRIQAVHANSFSFCQDPHPPKATDGTIPDGTAPRPSSPFTDLEWWHASHLNPFRPTPMYPISQFRSPILPRLCRGFALLQSKSHNKSRNRIPPPGTPCGCPGRAQGPPWGLQRQQCAHQVHRAADTVAYLCHRPLSSDFPACLHRTSGPGRGDSARGPPGGSLAAQHNASSTKRVRQLS